MTLHCVGFCLTANGVFVILHISQQRFKEHKMDLMQIMRENANARKIICQMNLADIARKYHVSFGDARRVQNYAALLEAAE